MDKEVCHPHNYDFFLISQAGLIVLLSKPSPISLINITSLTCVQLQFSDSPSVSIFLFEYIYIYILYIIYIYIYVIRMNLRLTWMQGTSRPTHYHVLVNENKLGPDDIQSLTNNLCYM